VDKIIHIITFEIGSEKFAFLTVMVRSTAVLLDINLLYYLCSVMCKLSQSINN
jgi:hypothetical protein